MLGRDHALSGATAWAGLCAAGAVTHPLAQLGGGVACAAAALLPDLDSVGSTAARSMGGLSRGVAYVVRGCSGGHRHGTHSLLGGAVFPAAAAAVTLWLAPRFPVPLVLAVAVGVACHIAGDMLTDHGCPLGWPFTLRCFWLLPRPLRITTGRAGEVAVRVLLIAALAGILALHFGAARRL